MGREGKPEVGFPRFPRRVISTVAYLDYWTGSDRRCCNRTGGSTHTKQRGTLLFDVCAAGDGGHFEVTEDTGGVGDRLFKRAAGLRGELSGLGGIGDYSGVD